MGLFGLSKSADDKRADEVRSGAVAPSRTERQRCWESRDVYFACLDRHDILDAGKDAKAATRACPGEGTRFERDCAAEWVTYFKKWRVSSRQKELRLKALEEQGANRIEIKNTAGGTVATGR